MIQNSNTEQIELINKLLYLIDKLWDVFDSPSVIEIAERAIKYSKNIEPLKYTFANGMEYIDTEGKEFRLDILQKEIDMIKSRSYSTLNSEKFGIASSIISLATIFSNLPLNEIKKSSDKNER